jgi:hypothetical protein
MSLPIDGELIARVKSVLDWHRREIKNPESLARRIPVKDAWKTWDDTRLWCTFFFSIISPGGSKAAREYINRVEDGEIAFELRPETLGNLSEEKRIKKIWEFGTGKNLLQKRLGRFFSKPENAGDARNFEYKLARVFEVLAANGFLKWFERLDGLADERERARALEFLPGSKFKVSRDFMNNIGMTSTLIPLDGPNILAEMREAWGWRVPEDTPSDREEYEEIEDAVRVIAGKIGCRVVEIDKAIFSKRTAGKAQFGR